MFSLKNLFKALSFILVIAFSVHFAIDIIQDKQNIMSFEDYDPPSSLVVDGKEIKKAKYPFIDVHSHQRMFHNLAHRTLLFLVNFYYTTALSRHKHSQLLDPQNPLPQWLVVQTWFSD